MAIQKSAVLTPTHEADLVPQRPVWVKNALGNPTGHGVRIGVIDSGWDRTVPAPSVQQGVGFIDPQNNLTLRYSDDDHDRIGHGTGCTDLILRIAPDATIYPIRVFGERLETDATIIKAAILWALEQRCHIVNISLGTLRADALYMLYTTCEVARRAGLLLVAASHANNASCYPAVFDNVISVGAGHFESPFDYYYRRDDAVECLAKGKEQRVRWLGGKKVITTGPSFAAPNITGILALFLERYPKVSLEEIRDLLACYALPPSDLKPQGIDETTPHGNIRPTA